MSNIILCNKKEMKMKGFKSLPGQAEKSSIFLI